MSYDLNFWKYKRGIILDHQEVYEKCCKAEIVEGLQNLPIESILKDLKREFFDWKRRESEIYFEDPTEEYAFQIFTTRQFIRFDCYGMQGADMNRIIDVMNKYNCPLFDPQVGRRFDK